MSRARTLLAVTTLAGGLTVGLGSPADAACYATYADQPRLTRAANGQMLVTGQGGGRLCAGAASVCLDRNVGTVSGSCRYYTGSAPHGPTGSVPCEVGVWQTYVVVTPSDNSRPHVLHSDPLLVAHCGVVAAA